MQTTQRVAVCKKLHFQLCQEVIQTPAPRNNKLTASSLYSLAETLSF